MAPQIPLRIRRSQNVNRCQLARRLGQLAAWGMNTTTTTTTTTTANTTTPTTTTTATTSTTTTATTTTTPTTTTTLQEGCVADAFTSTASMLDVSSSIGQCSTDASSSAVQSVHIRWQALKVLS